MKPKRPLLVLGPILALAGVWLFRFDLSFGPHYTIYDMTVTDTMEASHAGRLSFGRHSFMAGAFKGNAVNIGASAPIPDTAVQEFGESAKLDPKYIYIGDDGLEHYNGPSVPDPPSRFVKIPVRSRLPPRLPWQKYHFHFTLYPNDSIRMDIQVLDKGDCSHIDPLAKTAFLRGGPCSY